MQDELIITKASGEQVKFSEEKLRNSLLRSGATPARVQEIVSKVEKKLYPGISSKRIYRMAYSLLKSSSRDLAARYDLKRGIMELGPSGFPFEKYVAEIFRQLGYKTRTGELVQGNCVQHEIDVEAEVGHEHLMVECKFHNLPGSVCNVKIPLYVNSRFKDVEEALLKLPHHEKKFHQAWVVTNTRFSDDAIQYGNCAGLKLLGWNYPPKSSLKVLVDKYVLYPVTCLTSLTRTEKKELLERMIVLAKELCEDRKILESAGFEPKRIAGIIDEATKLCNLPLNEEG